MDSVQWTAVDRFFETSVLEEDPILNQVLSRCDRAGLPPHNVSPCQGRLLQILSLMSGARRILEIGTLGGYSTIWLARSIPADGRVVTIEAVEPHAVIAAGNLELAGVLDRVSLITGDAKKELQHLIDEGVKPFDLIFIDADKPGNPQYLELSLRLSSKGTVIIGDNVVREGAVADPESTDHKVRGVREYCMQLKTPGLLSTAIQTVGVKGYDGFAISIVQ